MARQEAQLPPFWRLTDQPLSIQFWVAGGLVFLFSVTSVAVLLVQLSSQTSTSIFLKKTYQSLNRLNQLEQEVFNQQAIVLEKAISQDRANDQKLLKAQKSWQNVYSAFEFSVLGVPGLADSAKRLGPLYQRWFDFIQTLIERNGKIGTQDFALASQLLKEIGQNVHQIRDFGQELLLSQELKEKEQGHGTFFSVAGLTLFLWIVFSFMLSQLYSSIAKPISGLSRGMNRYRGGDFATRVAVTNRSQIGFLESSFNDMAEKIESMVHDLKKLDQLKTDFLSTVTHELRTPMTSISGYVKLLLIGDAGEISDIQKDFLKIIDQNVVRLAHLINDILDVEALESGKVELNKQDVDLLEVLQECCGTFRMTAQQKNLKLETVFPEKTAKIFGDRARLVQIFMNLISNSIKYTQQGYVRVRVEQNDIASVIRIEDSGIGLTTEEQENLFQKFYRAPSGITSSESGTGLGLVIVKNLVEAHGGKVSVESVPQQGTKFTVTLPRVL